MVLAAGLGKRMRAANDTLPKPLIPLAGKPLIDYAIDALIAAGVEKIVVNVHYKAAQLVEHLGRSPQRAPRIVISHEEIRLETGGGVANALADLGDEPFFVLNSDSILCGNPGTALKLLGADWRDDVMDACLLVCPKAQARGFDGAGDFFIEDGGKLRRALSLLRHSRARHGVGDERYSAAWRADPLRRHVSYLHRLLPTRNPAGGVDAYPHGVCDDP